MSLKNKRILGAFLVLVFLIFGISFYNRSKGNEDSKTITIQIVVDNETIYQESVQTEAALLSDCLKEMKANKTIVLEYEDSTYGMYITGMGKDTLVYQDAAAGKYWVYDSENNKQCNASEYCDALDSLAIEDGDCFVFTLSSFE